MTFLWNQAGYLFGYAVTAFMVLGPLILLTLSLI